MKKIPKTRFKQAASTYEPKWQFFKEMQFLNDCSKPRNQQSNLHMIEVLNSDDLNDSLIVQVNGEEENEILHDLLLSPSSVYIDGT